MIQHFVIMSLAMHITVMDSCDMDVIPKAKLMVIKQNAQGLLEYAWI